MILQTLKSYYDRAADQLAPLGWIRKAVDFAIDIDRDGTFKTLIDLRDPKNGKDVGKPLLLPNIGKQAEKHTNSGKDANLLWDDAPFILGMKTKGRMTMEAFCQTIEEFFPDAGDREDAGITAVKAFCRNRLPLDETREMIAANLPRKNGRLLPSILTFHFRDDPIDRFIIGYEAVKSRVARYYREMPADGVCSVTGERAPISRNHTVLKNIWGGQSSGVNLVSFNASAFTSHNKEGGYNSPVGEQTMFAYTTALNALLGRDSSQRIQVGDASTVFWSEKPSQLEEELAAYITDPPKDDPDENSDLVRALYESVKNGALPPDDEKNRFYVLGLAPNAARVAVRFWIVGTVAQMKRNLVRHFDDIRIAHGPNDRDELPLYRLLTQTAVQGKSDNIPPNLAGDVMRGIMEGTPYPLTALGALLRRTRAERSLPHARAAFIKACINRSPLVEDPKEKEMPVSLDLENTNIGYRLGRLFAALEKTQLDALPGVKATIRDRFYGSASSTPAAVFPTLIRTSQHHLGKLDQKARIYRERLIGEIMNEIADFPPVLPLSDQGRFAIGYYQQMQDFYTRKAPAAAVQSEAGA